MRAIQHASDPAKYGPAGGVAGSPTRCACWRLVFGPLAAIMIGIEAGTGDLSAGVFRDLVVTGRSRVALFASRVPAALAAELVVCVVGYVVLVIGVVRVRRAACPRPARSLILEGFGFTILSTGVVCVVAVGFAVAHRVKPGAITVLIAW